MESKKVAHSEGAKVGRPTTKVASTKGGYRRFGRPTKKVTMMMESKKSHTARGGGI